MPNTNSTIVDELNFLSTIESIRTSQNFTPKARVHTLGCLLQACTSSINTCDSAYTSALLKISESQRYKERLDAMTDLSPEDRQQFINMTDQVLNDNMIKKEQINKELSGLKECKEKAEDACEHTRLDYIETSSS